VSVIAFAALALLIGVAMPAGAVQGAISGAASASRLGSKSGATQSSGSSLAARRAFVRQRLAITERSAGEAEAKKFGQTWKALSPRKRQALSVQVRSQGIRQIGGTSHRANKTNVAKPAVRAAASTDSVQAEIYDFYVTGPTGQITQWNSVGGGYSGGDITPGEELTAYAEVQADASTSEEVTVVFTVSRCRTDGMYLLD
jgi:hypothetical protein